MKFFNNFFNFLKLLFTGQKQKQKEILNQLLSEIEIGDIIWAKRYRSEKEKKSIPKGHREGPYIVLGKNKKGLICSKGSSVVPTMDINSYMEFSIRDYNLYKETYFHLKNLKLINEYSFIKKLDKLNLDDIDKLFQEFKYSRRNYFNENEETIDYKIPLKVGDIVNINYRDYLILDIEKEKMLCIKIPKNIGSLKYKLNINKFKELDYSKLKYFDLNEKCEYINTVNRDILLYVLRNQKEYTQIQQNKTVPQRGSVIKIENQYYYVYGEEGQQWLTLEIFKFNSNTVGRNKIIINNRIFYTNFADLRIDKQDNYYTLFLASEKEMDLIKEQRKEYIKSEKNKENQNNIIEIGSIIESKHYKKQRYIVTHICAKTYDCISLNQLMKGVYHPILIKKTDAKLSKNNSIKGIKWLENNKEFNMKNIYKESVIKQILETQKAYLTKKTEKILENVIETSRGCITSIDNKLYYIYGEEGQKWLLFEVFENEELEYLVQIKVENKNFYTNYQNTIEINKTEIKSSLFLATENEMDEIKKSKKNYNKNKLEKNKIQLKKQKSNMIIEKDGEFYVVLEKLGNLLECVSIYEKGQKDCKKQYFNIEEVKLSNEIELKTSQKCR